MRILFCVALASLMTISTAFAGEVDMVKKRRGNLFKHDYTAAYSVQTVSVKTACFPEKLEAILAHIRDETGRKPIVTSGHRPRAGTSQHSHCLAADIRVPGLSDKAIIAAASTAPGIGGIGRYCNGIIHVDVGPQRRWTHCGRSRS
ncbi:YcbK family protein [Rhizobium oryzicola]|uniref:YcbK family protein n=1 Tax=Rhizobium oryzicola TaxID=1232668 RepID=UPI003F52EF3F